MSVNNKIYPLRLALQDYNKLMHDSENAGLSVSDYLRKLINEQAVIPKPPESFKELAWAISKVGNSIDQLVRKATEVGISREDVMAVNFLLTKIIGLMREMG